MFRKLIVAVVVMTATTAAQALDFKVLADRKADFKSIATYTMGDVQIIRSSGAKVKKANIDALRDAVEQQLQEEGLRRDDKAPDVRVSVVAGTQPSGQPESVQGEPYFDGQWRILPKQGGEEAPEQSVAYSQATLRIDMKDVKTGNVIWRAVGNDMVKLPVSRKFVDAQLHLVFEQYPPPAAQ